ncbi:hypothetical protein C1646_768527 [Rhizophagus diaphanus]|nr:hypothetical protein C1646_768527 [Rhizophagus diaphanus] [Rhizophagus sp. MUCL 43196]
MVELLNLKYGSGLIKLLEERLSQISRYPNLKIFKNGFERLNRLTASEYRDLMKIILFALDNLTSDENLNKNLCDIVDRYMRHQNIMTLISKLQLQVYNQIRNNQNLNNLLWLRDFEKLKSCIYDYFQDIEKWSIQDIENETIKINVNYFSDVCIEMDESEQNDYLTDNDLCYAKVLLIIQVLSTKLEKNLELALIYWYDFAYYDRDDNDMITNTQYHDDDTHDNLYFYKHHEV